MAPRSKSKKKKTQKRQRKVRKHKQDNVVKLVTHGKVSGQFSQSSFSKLSPLVRVPLEDICDEGHVFLGFIKSGRYILSYTKVDVPYVESEPESETDDPELLRPRQQAREERPLSGYSYTLYWWEFNLHSKLKLVQQVKLFANQDAEEFDLQNLHVCEWPNDDSNIAIFGFDAQTTSTDQLMISLENDVWCNWFVTIAPNPPAKPCSLCSAMNTHSGSGVRCLEHGFALHGECEVDNPFPFQPALQLKKDKVILLKEIRHLVACAFYLCPAGEQSQSCQMLYTKRAVPPSGQPSSPPSMLPQGSAEDRHPSTGSPASSSPSSSSLPSSSSQEADLSKPSYINYKRLHYYLPQPGAERQRDKYKGTLHATDLKGREQMLLPGGPCDGQSLCVEEMELDVGRVLSVFLHDDPRDYKFDFVMMEVCPETDTVLIGVGLYWESEERNMRVSWDLSTGLCSVIGVSDLTKQVPVPDNNRHYGLGDPLPVSSHRKSCVDTVMECSVPESSSHRVNVLLNVDDDLSNTVLADNERCTWVTTI